MTTTTLASPPGDEGEGYGQTDTDMLELALAMDGLREDARGRLGSADPRCHTCTETDPLALSRSDEGAVECHECQARAAGRTTTEAHHPAGRHNLANVTIEIPANDHRVLSAAQHLWPTTTLRNPNASPLIAAAAALDGWINQMWLTIERAVGWIPDFLRHLNDWLTEHLGPQWWRALPPGTP